MIKVNENYIFFYSLLLISIILKFLFIEQDLPNQRLTEYNEFDQFWYTQPVRSWMSSYSCLFKGDDYPRIMFDLFQNFWTYPFLYLFGNNFYGFKIPVVLISIFIIFFLKKILSKKDGSISIVSMIILVMISFDFLYNITSRVQNPCIYSLFSFCSIFFLLKNYLNSYNSSKKNLLSFLIGFVSISAVFLIYVFNAFILASVGIFFLSGFLIFKFVNKNEFFLFCFGILLGFLFYNFITFIVFEKTVYDLFLSLKNFGGADEFRVINQLEVSFFQKIKSHIGSLFLLTFFRLNLFYLPIIISGLFILSKNFLNKDKLSYFILLSLFFINVQNWFEPHYSSKKMIVLIPVFLFLCKLSINFILNFNNEKISNKVYFLIFFIIGFLAAIYNFNLSTSEWYNNFWFGDKMSKTFNIINLSVLFLCPFLLLLLSKTKSKILIALSCFIFLAPSSFLISKHILFNKTYYCKNSLIEISKITKKSLVFNGNNFTLYNDFICSGFTLSCNDIVDKNLLSNSNSNFILLDNYFVDQSDCKIFNLSKKMKYSNFELLKSFNFNQGKKIYLLTKK